MRITLNSVGGLDEIRPLAALGHALQEQGHSVLLCIPEKFRERIMKRSLRMISCGASFEEFLEGKTGTSDSDFLRKLTAEVPVHFVSLRDALREADLLIGGLLSLAAPSMAEQLSLPYIQIITSPIFLDASQFPAAGIAKQNGLLASLEQRKRARRWNQQLRTAINRERGFSGLSSVKDLYSYLFESGFQLIAVEPELMQQSKFENAAITGFWFTEEEIPVEKEWQEFFASDSPVACVGPVNQPEELQLALSSEGFRVLFSADWKDHPAMKADAKIYTGENQVPSECSVVVHNGNTGITAATMRSGVPHVVLPQVMTQTDWAHRVEKLRIGISSSADVKSAAQAAKKVGADSGYKERATELSKKITARNSLATTLEMIERRTG